MPPVQLVAGRQLPFIYIRGPRRGSIVEKRIPATSNRNFPCSRAGFGSGRVQLALLRRAGRFWLFGLGCAGRGRWRLFRRRRRRFRRRWAALIGPPFPFGEPLRSKRPRMPHGRGSSRDIANSHMVKHVSLPPVPPNRSLNWRLPKTIRLGVRAYYWQRVNGDRAAARTRRDFIQKPKAQKIRSMPCLDLWYDIAQSMYRCWPRRSQRTR